VNEGSGILGVEGLQGISAIQGFHSGYCPDSEHTIVGRTMGVYCSEACACENKRPHWSIQIPGDDCSCQLCLRFK
jgi:hypothetical protein